MLQRVTRRIEVFPRLAKYTLALAMLVLIFTFAGPAAKSPLESMNWASVPIWVSSADCARETGALLVLCRKGGIVPLSDENAGEDPGHALMLGLYSAITGDSVNASDVSRVNTHFNFFGLVVLAGLMFSLGLPFACFVVLTLGAAVAVQFHALAPHPAQFGASCLAAILPIVILTKSRLSTLWIPAGVFCLALSSIFRQSIGMMGMTAALIAISLSIYRNKWRVAPIYAGLAVATLLAYQAPYFLLRARDAVYSVPATTMLERHGAWHSLYIGLGVVDNPFGIVWDDSNGDAAAKRVDPNVVFGSKAYYNILQGEYLRTIVSHPFTTLRIYFDKLRAALEQKLPTGLPLFVPILIVGACVYWTRSRASSDRDAPATDAVLITAAAFICMYLGQAALIHFSMQYLFPIQIFLVLGTGILVEFLLSPSEQRSITAAPPP